MTVQTTPRPSNIIGPFTREDWYDLIALKKSIVYMKDLKDTNFLPAIEKEQALYDEIWTKYFPKTPRTLSLRPASGDDLGSKRSA